MGKEKGIKKEGKGQKKEKYPYFVSLFNMKFLMLNVQTAKKVRKKH